MTYEYRTYRELAILNSGVIAVAPAPDKNVPSLAYERNVNIRKQSASLQVIQLKFDLQHHSCIYIDR